MNAVKHTNKSGVVHTERIWTTDKLDDEKIVIALLSSFLSSFLSSSAPSSAAQLLSSSAAQLLSIEA